MRCTDRVLVSLVLGVAVATAACDRAMPRVQDPVLWEAGRSGGLCPPPGCSWRLIVDGNRLRLDSGDLVRSPSASATLDANARSEIAAALRNSYLPAADMDYSSPNVDGQLGWLIVRDQAGNMFRYSFAAESPPEGLRALNDLAWDLTRGLLRCADARAADARACVVSTPSGA